MYRRLLKTLLFFALILFVFSVTAFAEQAIVTGEAVNVRSGPGLAYSNFTSLTKGMTVEVLNRSNADWYQVSWDGNVGYVYSAYLQLTESSESASYTVALETTPGYINAMYVSFRSGPGTSYSVLGTYSNGKELTIRGDSGEWTAVTIDGKDGFVYHDYVSAGSVSAAVIEQENSASADVFGGVPIPVQQTSAAQSGTDTAVGSSMIPVSVGVPEAGGSLTEVPVSGSASSDAAAAQSVPTVPLSGSGSVSATLGVNPEEAPAKHTGEITGNFVRFRTGPGTTYSIIGTYNRGTELQITGSSNGWTQASIDGISGYFFSDYVKELSSAPPVTTAETVGQASAVLGQTAAEPEQNDRSTSESVSQTLGLSENFSEAFTPTDGYINGNGVRLRQAPSMTAAILNENLNTGNTARILGISGDWTRVIVNGQEGFVYSAYVQEGRYEPAGSVRRASGSDLGKEIANYALTFIGTPYTWGGKSPATGFDCSGFVQYVFSQFGYTTSSIANDVRNEGTHVEPADIQPGDVLCFYSGNNYVGHVGIYIGDNSFVHAANSATGVVTTSLSVGYYAQRGYEIRRII